MPYPQVQISDVILRDGLQLVRSVLPTEDKKRIVDGLYGAGLRHLDITSFVPPARFPQFADASDIVAHARRYADLDLSAFAPNPKGAERAAAAGVDAISFVISVSDSHNRANVNRTTAEQVAAAREVRAFLDGRDGQPVRLVLALATVFGCSIEGEIAVDAVARLAVEARAAGADEICLSDTVGYADPLRVRQVIAAVRAAVGADIPLRLHLHDTTGTGMACAFAAMEEGITLFDASLGGLGGCPFAAGASGNISTEDLVYLMERSGVSTGIDLDALLVVTALLHASLPDEELASHLFKSGPPKSYGAHL